MLLYTRCPLNTAHCGSQRSNKAALPAGRPRRCQRVEATANGRGPASSFQAGAQTRRKALAALGSLALLASGIAPTPAGAAVAASTAAYDKVKVALNELINADEHVLASLSNDVVFKFPTAYPGDEMGGEFKGKYGVIKYLARAKRITKDLQVADLKLQPGDGKDQVITRFRLSGRMVASNSRFSTSVTQVWTLAKDGQVASMRAYYDTASIAKAAGVAAN